jgi:ribosomal protein L11 methyltransferase
MKTYKEYKISTVPFDVDTISGMLWQLDIDGINEYDNYLSIFVSENKSTSHANIEELLNHLIYEKIISSYKLEVETLEERNWNEEYEKNVHVIEISDRIVIKPSFKEYTPQPDQLIITIDPKMSFGTGEHITTKLVIRFLEKYVLGGENVLDIGSGTGILAIGSVLLGAESAIGIDIDEWCLINGRENVAINNLENIVDIRIGELKDIKETGFDLISANINKHILIDLSEAIRLKIKKTGKLILSGLLDIDENDIVKHYESSGFKLHESSNAEGWIALVFIPE